MKPSGSLLTNLLLLVALTGVDSSKATLGRDGTKSDKSSTLGLENQTAVIEKHQKVTQVRENPRNGTRTSSIVNRKTSVTTVKPIITSSVDKRKAIEDLKATSEREDFEAAKKRVESDKKKVEIEKKNIEDERKNIENEKRKIVREKRNIESEKQDIAHYKQWIKEQKRKIKEGKKERKEFEAEKKKFEAEKKNVEAEKKNIEAEKETPRVRTKKRVTFNNQIISRVDGKDPSEVKTVTRRETSTTLRKKTTPKKTDRRGRSSVSRGGEIDDVEISNEKEIVNEKIVEEIYDEELGNNEITEKEIGNDNITASSIRSNSRSSRRQKRRQAPLHRQATHQEPSRRRLTIIPQEFDPEVEM